MKTLILIAAMFAALNTTSTFAKANNSEKSSLVGTWKYSTASAVNDFQKINDNITKLDYSTEYFIFQDNNKFRHEFVNKEGEVVKVLKGKWKVVMNKIKIDYSEFNYSLNLDYFFLDKDLVLGQNFNHIIFSKDNLNDQNIASIK